MVFSKDNRFLIHSFDSPLFLSVEVFASGSIPGKGSKKPVRDGQSGVKHRSGQSRDPRQSGEGLGGDDAVAAAGLLCQSDSAGNRSVCLGPSVRLALHHGRGVRAGVFVKRLDLPSRLPVAGSCSS